MTVGERIKAIRKEKGLTQKQVANGCGMADSAIRKYESGLITPKIETLQRIADALGVHILDLLGVTEQLGPHRLEFATKDGSPLSDAIREYQGLDSKQVYDRLSVEEKKQLLTLSGLIQPTVLSTGAEQLQNESSTENEVMEQIKAVYGEIVSDTFSMYVQLDVGDQGEIRGEIKQMLKKDKYIKQEGNLA